MKKIIFKSTVIEQFKRKEKLLQGVMAVFLVIAMLLPTQLGNLSEAQAASSTESAALSDFVGSWNAAGYQIGTSKYSGYLVMSVSEDGSFSIYDAEGGNPGIKGQLTVVDATTIQMTCEEEDFDSPWDGLQLEDQLEYHFYNSDQIRITYNSNSIVFSKNGAGVEFSTLFSSENWSQDWYKEWYSNDGVTASVTYKVVTDIDTILLYKVKNNTETLIGSFCGLTWTKKTGVLKTITELSDASKLPKNWRTMKEGRHFQSFKITYNSSKHKLTLMFNKKSYSFYSNITYGIKKGSDYESVYEKTWKCNTSDKKLRFYTQYYDGEYELKVYDKNDTSGYYGNATITVDESKKKVTIQWIKDRCTTDFYKSNKGNKSLTYTLKNEKLTITYGKKTYTFTVVD